MKEPVLCHVTCITIPRVLPSDVYVSWIFNGDNGSLPCYVADQPVLTTEDNFTVECETKESTEMIVSLNAFNKNSIRYQIGHQKINLPVEEVAKEQKPMKLIEIDSKIGKFTITMQFEKGAYQDEILPITDAKGPVSPLDQYYESILTIKPVPDRIHPARDTWGSTGLYMILEYLSKTDVTLEDIDFLDKIQTMLENKQANINGSAKIVLQTIKFLTGRDMLYISYSGEVGTVSQLHGKQMTPLLSVLICKYLKSSNQITPENVENAILLICNLACAKETNDELNFYLLANIYALLRFIQKEYPNKYGSISSMLASAAQTTLARFLTYFNDVIQTVAHDSKQICTQLVGFQESFMMAGFGNGFIQSIMQIMLQITDFRVVSKWIFDLDTRSLDMGLLINDFKEFQFPLIHSLHYLIAFAKSIIKNRRFPEEIVPEMQGEWFSYVMFRLVNSNKYDFTEKEILSLNTGKIIPDFPDVEAWAFENKDMKQDPPMTKPLPDLPKEFEMI